MRKTFTPWGGTRRARVPLLVAAVAALAMVAAACGGGGSGGSAGGGGGYGGGGQAPPAAAGGGAPEAAGGGAPEAAPPGAEAVTATAGEFQLPPGTPGAGKPPVVIGSKNFSEQTLLGELYGQALEAKGFTIQQKANIGGSELIDRVFQANQIQMYPEYLGEIATSVADQPVPPTPLATYQVAEQFEENQRNATILKQTPFQDTDVLIVKPQFAQQNNLQTVPDLNNVGPGGQGVTLAAQPPFRTRQNGLVGMQQQYGLSNVQFRGVKVGGPTYQALDSGAVNVADGFSTDYQLLSGNYVELKDPKNIFGSQYVAPVIKQPVLAQQGPAFAQTCNWVSGLLSTQAIQAMNKAVQGSGQDPAVVAKQFLTQNGLK